jgi:hypothetical protein
MDYIGLNTLSEIVFRLDVAPHLQVENSTRRYLNLA